MYILLVKTIFALTATVVKHKLFSSHGGLLTYAMYYHRKTIKSNEHTMKLSHGEPSQRQAQGTNTQMKGLG